MLFMQKVCIVFPCYGDEGLLKLLLDLRGISVLCLIDGRLQKYVIFIIVTR